MSRDTTEEDLQKFKGHCLEWISRLNLNDWSFGWKIEALEECNARAVIIDGSRKVLFKLNTNIQVEYESLECMAVHECLEVLLGDVSMYLHAVLSNHVVDDEIHRVIHRLIKAFNIPNT